MALSNKKIRDLRDAARGSFVGSTEKVIKILEKAGAIKLSNDSDRACLELDGTCVTIFNKKTHLNQRHNTALGHINPIKELASKAYELHAK
ncbi:MAG: hypothetical protein CMH26_07335 [Micavibrio sp.]|nr:hypothetical protein [Micavibrio sp.]|tara:strand:+ start:1404 stop:1676 length:273 start_codon:yes stop_codon:yes gene_type:complete